MTPTQIVAAWEDAAREQRRAEAERRESNAWLLKYETVGDVPEQELKLHLASVM